MLQAEVKESRGFGSFLILQLMAVALTGLTLILGAAPLRVARLKYSASLYWFSSALSAIVIFALSLHEFAFGFLSLTLLVGLYSDFERRRWHWMKAGAAAVALSSTVLYGLMAIWTSSQGIDWTQRLQEEMAKLNGGTAVELPMDLLLAQVPSFIVVVMMMSMAFSLLWETRLRTLMGESVDIVSGRVSRFSSFQVPDMLIWLLIPSLLFSTVHFDVRPLQTAALNILNVLVVLYLFQGLAVLHRLFLVLKVGPLMRALFYFFLIIQIHQSVLLLSIVGVVDFWADFRKKLDNYFKDKKDGRQE